MGQLALHPIPQSSSRSSLFMHHGRRPKRGHQSSHVEYTLAWLHIAPSEWSESNGQSSATDKILSFSQPLLPTSLRKAAIHEMETFRPEHLPIDSSRCNVRLRTASSTGLPAGGTRHGWLKYVCCTNKRWTGLKLNCDWHLKFIFATAETVGRSVPPLMLQPKWKSCQLLVCCASTGRGSRVKCNRLGDVEVYKPFTWGWPVYIVKTFAIISI